MIYGLAGFLLFSLMLNVWQFRAAWRLAQKVAADKKLLFRAVCAIEYYNKNISDGTAQKPKLDWLHGDFQ